MNKQSSSCAPKSCLVHGPQGCGKSTNARAIAKALGLSNILDNWQAGAPVPLLDTLVLTNADNPQWYFKGRVMTFDQAMQITQPGGDTPAGERSMTNNAHRWECVELDGDELHSCKKCRRQTHAPRPETNDCPVSDAEHSAAAWLGQAGLYANRLEAIRNGEQLLRPVSQTELMQHARHSLFPIREGNGGVTP